MQLLNLPKAKKNMIKKIVFSSINKACLLIGNQNAPKNEVHIFAELTQGLSHSNNGIMTRSLIEWQLHTISRNIEATGAKWDEINLEAKIWVIPAERMKTNSVHVIPLTKQALAILELLKPITGHSKYLFKVECSKHGRAGCFTELKTIPNIAVHNLRELAFTTLSKQGFDNNEIDSCLSYIKPNRVSLDYNQQHLLEKRRKLMDWWSVYVERILHTDCSSNIKAIDY